MVPVTSYESSISQRSWGETSEHAYQIILEAIVEGKFAGDGRLREAHLTALTGVSRTPVREALNRLTAEGIVNQAKNRGAQLVRLTREDEVELLMLRAQFEPYATRLAAPRIPAAEIDRLATITEQMDYHAGLRDFSPVEMGRLNNMFHNCLIEWSGSVHLEKALQALVVPAYVARTFRRYSKRDLDRSLKHHWELVEAAHSGEGQWAEAVMRNHILAARRTLS